MGFKINGDINARNMQIGDNNLMTVIHEGRGTFAGERLGGTEKVLEYKAG